VLELDDALVAWSRDTLQSDEQDRGRAAVRRMIVALGELAKVGARDPNDTLGPYVEALLAERIEARAGRRFGDADRIRDRLTDLGLEVRDTPDGTEWRLPGTGR
jgi:cysteinyl-tRNA synthetase